MSSVVDFGRVGELTGSDGATQPLGLNRLGALKVADRSTKYQEATLRGNVFSLLLNATTTGVAAGNITGAAAAASTQFALWNPTSSNKALVLLKFGMGITSGTPGAGPMFHNIATIVPTVASTGTALSNLTLQPAPTAAKFMASAAGAALTGGGALTALRVADFTSTNTAQASVGELKAIEYIDGEIVLIPGTMWVPCWSAAGTALLNAYSITWEEVPYP